MLTKPGDVFDRKHEWADLARFATDPSPGLQIGIIRGRRRHGKSWLLEHLCAATGGMYTLAIRQSREMALGRYSEALSEWLGYSIGQFSTWVEALDATVDALLQTAKEGTVPVLALDEFPYLVAHSPELPSAIQALYDKRGPSTRHASFRLVLCGSAISVMSTLAAGDQALRGRAMLDLRIGPFRYRDSARYWEADAEAAFLIDAVLGGAPGYRDIVRAIPTEESGGLLAWLEQSLLNPSHILFTEPDYLLAEDPNVGDRTIYHTIWQAVSRGASTPTKIGGLLGMDAKSLGYHLRIMRDAAFLRYDQDLLLQRRPVITVADPAVRFHNLIVAPNLAELELREAERIWARSQDTFSSKILGPHFEDLARQWTRGDAEKQGLAEVGHVGTTIVACREHRGHEVDVVALDHESIPRHKTGRITLLGEAKHTTRPRGRKDLQRILHVRDLLVADGWDAGGAALALFSRSGFTDELRDESSANQGMALLDLEALYRA